MKRRSTNAKKDKKIFRHTAIKSKLINVVPTSMRGGTRL